MAKIEAKVGTRECKMCLTLGAALLFIFNDLGMSLACSVSHLRFIRFFIARPYYKYALIPSIASYHERGNL
jgi:hypothetical protein